MNTHHKLRLTFSGLAAAVAVIAPAVGWAGEHYLGLTGVVNSSATNANPATSCTSTIPSPTPLADKGIVTGETGALTKELTLRGLCTGNGNARADVDFTGDLAPVTRQVKMCKSWTARDNTTVYDWLDQGVSNIGVTGTLTTGNFRVVFALDDLQAVDTGPGSCTLANQGTYDYTVTRSVRVLRDDAAGEKVLATANFTFGNVTSNVPEPGTLSLIGLGLAGLGWMGARRARKARVGTL